MDHIGNIYSLKSVYFAYIYHVTQYWVIFRANSSNSGKIFILQKKIVRIMANQSCFQKGKFYAGIKIFKFTV
jgi:hypothetical protein